MNPPGSNRGVVVGALVVVVVVVVVTSPSFSSPYIDSRYAGGYKQSESLA